MLLKVDGVNVPYPSSFRTGIMDISKADRVATGRIVIDRIATKIKLEMEWNYLTPQQLSTLLRLVSPVNFKVEYVDPRTNRRETGVFYVGDRNMGTYSFINGEPVYTEIAFNFVEV